MSGKARPSSRTVPEEWAGLPLRTCLGCGSRKPKQYLVRLVLDASGQPVIDGRQAAQSRGGYLCGPGCLKAALKRKSLGKAFRGQLKGVDPRHLWVSLGGAADGWG